MATEIIPWHIFFETLHKQPKARLDEWLAGWCFDEEGALLMRVPAKLIDDLSRRVYNTVYDLNHRNLKRRRTFH